MSNTEEHKWPSTQYSRQSMPTEPGGYWIEFHSPFDREHGAKSEPVLVQFDGENVHYFAADLLRIFPERFPGLDSLSIVDLVVPLSSTALMWGFRLLSGATYAELSEEFNSRFAAGQQWADSRPKKFLVTVFSGSEN